MQEQVEEEVEQVVIGEHTRHIRLLYIYLCCRGSSRSSIEGCSSLTESISNGGRLDGVQAPPAVLITFHFRGAVDGWRYALRGENRLRLPIDKCLPGAASDDFFLSRTALDRRHITASKQLPVAQFRLYLSRSPCKPLSLFYHFGP
jgi:hypothetical protein